MTIDQMEKAVLDTIEKNKPFFSKDDEHRVMIIFQEVCYLSMKESMY